MEESKESTGKIIDYYSLLFTYPSHWQMVLTMLFTSLLGSFAFFYFNKPNNLITSLVYGTFLFFLVVASDYLINPLFSKNKLMSPRRITILSYSGLILYFIISIIALLASSIMQSTRTYGGIYLSISLIAAIRTLVFLVLSDEKIMFKWLALSMQPALIFMLNTFFLKIDNSLISRYLLATLLMIIGIWVSLWTLEKKGQKIWAGGLLLLFKGFLYAWAEDEYKVLEQELSKVGENVEVICDVIDLEGEENTATLLVPYIHPGPFRKMGSSALPERLVNEYKRKKKGEAIVAHGISTHELDIINHSDLVKIIETITNIKTVVSHSRCTRIIRRSVNNSVATCQLFGEVALITLSLSNKSYDDLPIELLHEIQSEVERKGIIPVIIDSHNSILIKNELTQEDLENLLKTSLMALEDSLDETQHQFKMGVSRINPEEWDNTVGMGGSGIASISITLENSSRYTYIVFDGNNMKKGLKKEIRKVGEQFVDDLVVMTSDTHVVNALGATSSGYYPIGEKMEEEKILSYVKENIQASLMKQEKTQFKYGRSTIPDVLILGKNGLERLANTTENGFSLFTRIFSIITCLVFIVNIILIFM
jgi:predicted neutral ceramidase superfamily lipid hydrolase